MRVPGTLMEEAGTPPTLPSLDCWTSRKVRVLFAS